MKIEPYEVIVRFDLVDAGKNDLISAVKEVTPLIRCKDCKHRPRRANKWVNVYGPKVPASDYAQHVMVEDETCPFLCDDPFYSEIPPDDFFCAYGERD